ncbi:esterase family protein [Paraglaciecola aquimarina]|uniref:Esterase family protein n=1 Tax=Paraglaciecola algarum TaxID=3050085 RepID=A0ABS9DE56_9ALTE|nr:alpha/beta hydrolase-fold protein [Paraglaciecola sp. G1-23]MCF2950049.1 esterase family protein [Paraglaciecola sp. G1-23]
MQVLSTKILFVSLLFCMSLKLLAEPLKVRTGLTMAPEQMEQEGVPKGKLNGPFEFHSTILKDTVRRYWVYVPAQYEESKAASVLVFQDGQRATNPKGSLRITTVLDNLIASGDMPTTIGIFITPGNKSKHYPDDLGMSNPNHRAAEYDAMNDSYARFIIEEMLPHVGKNYNLTKDPQQRAIGGTSSGAIAAFTVAWHKPDYFRKVYSSIGSYVSIGFKPNANPVGLGGQDYPALIRREPIRPIKMFMQDGVNDLDNEWGNWFLANQQMLSALNYANRIADKNNVQGARYQVTHVWTDGVHNDQHAGMLLPEGLRWLWNK